MADHLAGPDGHLPARVISMARAACTVHDSTHGADGCRSVSVLRAITYSDGSRARLSWPCSTRRDPPAFAAASARCGNSSNDLPCRQSAQEIGREICTAFPDDTIYLPAPPHQPQVFAGARGADTAVADDATSAYDSWYAYFQCFFSSPRRLVRVDSGVTRMKLSKPASLAAQSAAPRHYLTGPMRGEPGSLNSGSG